MAFWFGFWRDLDREMRELARRLRRLAEEIAREAAVPPAAEFTRPLVDVYETPDEVVVVAELPGVRKEDITVHATEDTVEIRAEVRRAEEIREEDYFRRERLYKGFYRRVRLPTAVQPERARAKYENGVLTIRLPKAAAERKHRVKID